MESSKILNITSGLVIDKLNNFIWNEVVKTDEYRFRRWRVVRAEYSESAIMQVIEGVKNRIGEFLDEVILDLEQGGVQQELEFLKQAQSKQDTPKYILIVEGKDDVFVWRGLLQGKGIDHDLTNIRIISGSHDGGLTEAISAFQAVKKLQLKSRIKLVIDSDNNKQAVEKKITNANIGSSEYKILEEKEIESYLLDSKAISSITSVGKDIIEKKMQSIKRRGKEQLDQLFRELGLSKPDEQTKQLIARALSTIPKEIDGIINEIKQEIS